MFSGITGFIESFRENPAAAVITLCYTAVCILFSLILHEIAHGYVAMKCGDPTAKWMGRLTLDPRKHLDPIGTLCMVFLHVGWARPVPINPRNFRNYRRDYILVSLAGIITNLCLCLLSLLVAALLSKLVWSEEIIAYMQNSKSDFLDVYSSGTLPLALVVYSGQASAVPAEWFNAGWLMHVERLFLMLAQMNLGLAVFNLLPVPPLDGYRFLDQFVFKGNLAIQPQTMQIIRYAFLFLCISGVLTGLLTTVNGAVFGVFAKFFSILI